MSGWLDPWPWWATALLGYGVWCGLLLLYNALRPMRDFYIVQRRYYDRLYEEPWRGKLIAAHYHGFIDYLAAKALFDANELDYISVLDDGGMEAEHSLFMVPARSKEIAISRLKAGKAYSKELLHKTPFTHILKRRAFWQKAAKDAEAADAELDQTAGEPTT